MRLLLDTHAFLWWLQDAPQLSATARDAVADPGSLVFVSAASIWEIAIKRSLGRIDSGEADLVAEIEANDFVELPIAARHAEAAGSLPRHHEDPFDRMLVAQARLEGLTCVTRDGAFGAYDVATLWS
ncbi:MAG: type II toxin-antitoxin system VapC family toxin [Thermoanaerobaculia bacterium]